MLNGTHLNNEREINYGIGIASVAGKRYFIGFWWGESFN
ncbi:hypothetical protein AT1219_10934 [Vibrio alginolyticus]